MTQARTLLVLLAAATVFVLVSGCSKPDPLKTAGKRLVGAWTAKIEEEEIRFEFKPDGTLAYRLSMPISGTWEVLRAEKDDLTLKTVEEMPSIGSSIRTEGGKTVETTKTSTKKTAKEYAVVFKSDNQISIVPTKVEDQPIGAMMKVEPFILDRQ